ncbi:MAG: SDR family NAD(P)-dependent oxidoreductase [Spirochaetaceae bacterium]|nr:SDR family NAD(P)-dependent oxidoreductase [Spirochaetaceae bacterium]
MGVAPLKGFYGRHALIIGGTGGIGKALAYELAQKGAAITVQGGSSQQRLDTTLSLLRSTGAVAQGFLSPITSSSTVQQVLACSAHPDILVCAWGPFKRGALETMSASDWHDLVWANLIFPGMLISTVLPEMVKRHWGRILLFGGTKTDTIRGFTTSAVYSAAKTALSVLAKSVVQQSAKDGICCNVICPGLTDTEYTDTEALRYNRSHGLPPLNPKDIARVALTVLENPHINGAIIPVDQGLVL